MWRFKVALHLSFGFPWQFSSTHLNPRVERGVIKANITSTNTTQRPSQGLPWSYPSRVHWAKCLVIWHQIVPASELYLCCRCLYIISQLTCNHGETFVKQSFQFSFKSFDFSWLPTMLVTLQLLKSCETYWNIHKYKLCMNTIDLSRRQGIWLTQKYHWWIREYIDPFKVRLCRVDVNGKVIKAWRGIFNIGAYLNNYWIYRMLNRSIGAWDEGKLSPCAQKTV